MSLEFRQKLLNWFCTVMVVLGGTSVALLVTWSNTAPYVLDSSLEGDAYRLTAPLAEAFLLYPILVAPSMFWHLLDFLQENAPLHAGGRIICGYPAFLATLTLLTSLWLLASTGYFTHNSCDDLDGALFHQCFITISRWIMIPIFFCLFGLLVICITKLFATFDSLFLRAK